LILGLTLLASCGGGGSGGGNDTVDSYSSPNITVNQFISALNAVDGASVGFESELILGTGITERSLIAGQEDWFVIFDAQSEDYKAVSLQYIRTLTYTDLMSSNLALADQFRFVEGVDNSFGLQGDAGGDDYETVIFNGATGYFDGTESSFSYEDEVETFDVNLMTGEKEEKEFAKKASNLSFTYEISMPTAMSLVSLGEKAESLLKKGGSQQELTLEDQAVLLKDLEHITGVTLEEVLAAGNSVEGKQLILKKITEKNKGSGITPQKLEESILPELFGLFEK